MSRRRKKRASPCLVETVPFPDLPAPYNTERERVEEVVVVAVAIESKGDPVERMDGNGQYSSRLAPFSPSFQLSGHKSREERVGGAR